MSNTTKVARGPASVAVALSVLSLCTSLYCFVRGTAIVQTRVASSRFALMNGRDQTLGWIEAHDDMETVSLVLFLNGTEQRYYLRMDENGNPRWQSE